MLPFVGQVLSESGAPLPGVPVVVVNAISGDEAASVVTDIVGRYAIEVPDGDYDFTVGSKLVAGVPVRGGGALVMLTGGEAAGIAYGKVCYLTAGGLAKKATSEGTELESTARYICITPGGVALAAVGIFKMGGEVTGVPAGTVGGAVWLTTDGGLSETNGGALVVALGVRSASTVLQFRPLLPAPAVPVITSPLTADGTVGVPFSYTITADGSGRITYDATDLPDGLSFDPDSGEISGTPTADGETEIPISATNAIGSDDKTLVLTVEGAGTVLSFNLTLAIVQAIPGQVGVAQHVNSVLIPPGFVVSETEIIVTTPLQWPMGYGNNNDNLYTGNTVGNVDDLWQDISQGTIGAGVTLPRFGAGHDNVQARVRLAPGVIGVAYYSEAIACDITFNYTLVPGP